MANTDAYQDAVSKLISYLDQTVDFARGQLPEVCKEILAYGAYSNTFWIWFSGVFAVLSLLIFILSIVKNDDCGGCTVACFMLLLGMSTATGANIMEAKKIELAPKLYVMEYLRSELSHN